MDGINGKSPFNTTSEYTPLRKPHFRNEHQTSPSSRPPSVLSPDAKEFVPRQNISQNRSLGTLAPMNSGNLSTGHHSAEHNQFRPRGGGRMQQKLTDRFPNESNNTSSTFTEPSEEEKHAIDYVSHIVYYLNENPGSYDSIGARVLNVFEGFSENQFVLSNSMEIIFSKSIEDQNFRYMGAKLYALLDSIKPHNNSLFRRLLNLKLTYHNDEILVYMQNEQHKVRGTTLFLAELFMQLRSNGEKIPQIEKSIIFSMNQILQKQSPENIKCICFTLKLAGFDLKDEHNEEITQIINALKSLNVIDVGTSRILENLFQLQGHNWGRSEMTSNSSQITEASNEFNESPVFYGPDGAVLTEEENNFLESNLPSENNAEDEENDSDEFELDCENDDEVEQAFREFVKNNSNKAC